MFPKSEAKRVETERAELAAFVGSGASLLLLVSCVGATPPPSSIRTPAQPTASAAPHAITAATSSTPPAPSATTSASATPPRSVKPQRLQFGLSAPLKLVAASSSGQWVVLCQDGGDGVVQPRLSLAGGTANGGEPIRDLLAHSANGRYLVVQASRAGGAETPYLVDAQSGSYTALKARLAARGHHLLEHPRLAFYRDSSRLVFTTPQRGELALVELASGKQRHLSFGKPIQRVREAAQQLVVELVDTSPDAKPRAEAALLNRAAEAPELCGEAPPLRATPTQRATQVSLTDKHRFEKPRLAPDFVAPFGVDYLARGRDGAIEIVREAGRTPLVEADCKGRVFKLSEQFEALLAGCKRAEFREAVALRAVAPKASHEKRDLDFTVAPGAEHWSAATTRFAVVYPGADVYVVDFRERTARGLETNDKVLALGEAHAIVRRGRELLRVSLTDGAAVRLGQTTRLPRVLRAPGWAYVEPILAPIEHGPSTVLDRVPLAIDDRGRRLLSAKPDLGPVAFR